jgi:hypothetical protein
MISESMDAWRPTVGFRSFGKLPSSQEAPNRLPSDLQRAPDFLLTHSLAVECNYFVVSFQSSLPSVVTQLLIPRLNTRVTIRRDWSRFLLYDQNCFRQRATLLL